MSPSGVKFTSVEPFSVRCVESSEYVTAGKVYKVTAVSEKGVLYQVRGNDNEFHYVAQVRFAVLPPCRICGRNICLDFNDWMNRKLLKLQMCHSCEFWALFLHDMKKEPHRHFVAKGNGYSASPDGSRGFDGKRGYGGARFYVKMNNGRLFTTNNLSHRGDVPPEWKACLPDNAVFLDTEEDFLADLAAQEHGAD